MARAAPLLPVSFTSAFVTYWSPMDRTKFISSGNMWFDYDAKCFRIDGLFNPWDVAGTKQHLWLTELSHYGEGVSYHLCLLYDRVPCPGAEPEHTIESRELTENVVPAREAIFPRDYLVETKATFGGTVSVLGLRADIWDLPASNRLGIRRVHLRHDSNELVRMEQEKRGDIVVRDFPNLVRCAIAPAIFDRSTFGFAPGSRSRAK